MSYMNRLWMAASVAVVNGHSDQGQKLKSGLKSLNHSKRRFLSNGGDSSDFRPLSGVLNSEFGDFVAEAAAMTRESRRMSRCGKSCT
ncbi:UNVERIFIED_CONTAM: hypothetical protein Sangu_1001200 [Sesamum angustifolium]|uniref:Uncharacterized protein n=1 Tax=Sesamum angustifolium TaxID=2727405 RepID=A0AAW2PDH4_9LAMI